MDVEDAKTVYIYLEHQVHLNEAQRRVRDLAWQVICRDAEALIKQYAPIQGEDRER